MTDYYWGTITAIVNRNSNKEFKIPTDQEAIVSFLLTYL